VHLKQLRNLKTKLTRKILNAYASSQEERKIKYETINAK
jgi:hypothetical protein